MKSRRRLKWRCEELWTRAAKKVLDRGVSLTDENMLDGCYFTATGFVQCHVVVADHREVAAAERRFHIVERGRERERESEGGAGH